jgi:hypothetical protein
VKASVFQSDGATPLASGSTMTEDALTDLYLSKLPLGSETTSIVLKVEATLPQDTNVTSTYYSCALAFK